MFRNNLGLNVMKCCCVSFFSNKQTININYSIGNVVLNRIEIVKNLGIVIDYRHTSADHMLNSCLGNLFFITKHSHIA